MSVFSILRAIKQAESIAAVYKQTEILIKSIEPTLQLQRDVVRQSRGFRLSYEHLIRELRVATDVAAMTRVGSQTLAEAVRRSREQIRIAGQSIADAQVAAHPFTRVLTEMRPILDHLAIASRPIALSEAYLEIARRYERALNERNADPVGAVIEELDEDISRAPIGYLSKDFYLTLIVSLVFFLLGQFSSMGSEQRIVARIENLEQLLSESVREIQSLNPKGEFFVAVRPFLLRAKYSSKSTAVGWIYPNQKVNQIKWRGKWLKVEYYDHVDGVYRKGWVLKKYLKRVDPALPQ